MAKLPPSSPGSPAAALRSVLGARLGAGALGVWVADVAAALGQAAQTQGGAADGSSRGSESKGSSSGSTSDGIGHGCGHAAEEEAGSAAAGAAGAGGPGDAVAGVGVSVSEALVERMVATQPQLLAHDSQVGVEGNQAWAGHEVRDQEGRGRARGRGWGWGRGEMETEAGTGRNSAGVILGHGVKARP